MKADADRLAELGKSIFARGIPARWLRPRVELLLGSDREIGRERHSQERRVGITPDQCAALRSFTKRLDIDLAILVVENAGARAGFSDHDYIHAAGAEVMTLDELEHHDSAPDVVHALKEPSTYEARMAPGFFCRIGALHSGDFDAKSGVAGLLKRGQVAVLDGSNIGSGALYRIPIRGRMSDFAGTISAEWCAEHVQSRNLRGRAVVVGGGRVGKAAMARLCDDDRFSEIVLFEAELNPARLSQIDGEIRGDYRFAKCRVLGNRGVDDSRLLDALSGAVALILGTAAKGEKAPRVITSGVVEERMAASAMVVDVSIDERGAIEDPGITSTMNVPEIIEHMEAKFTRVRYRAVNNMPRQYPGPASQAHGEVILPYLGTLLYLSALLGGAEAVAKYISELAVRADQSDPWTTDGHALVEGLIQDLRNGLALHHREGRLTAERCIADREGLEKFLTVNDIPHTLL